MDSLATKDGWRFHSTWPLSAVPGTSSIGLPFTYNATPDGVYPNNAEMRFDMPPVDEIWLRVRLHEPANYVMRHNTEIKVANAFAAGWRVGDQLLADDGVSRGTISSINTNSVFVRWAEKAGYDIWGSSSAQRFIRNTTRNSTLLSTGKAVWGGDKIMALWADNYSLDGTGPTIILGVNHDWTFGSTKNAIFTVGYRPAGAVGDGSRSGAADIGGGALFTSAYRGKYIDLAIHVRYSSSPCARNGVIETWLRYEGEGAFTRRHDIRDADIDRPLNLAGDQQKWQRGYLMGYSNNGYDEQTTFHISRIELFRTRPQDLP